MAIYAVASFRRGDLSGLLAKVGLGLFEGVTQAAELIRDDAKSRCPVDTGRLQDSIDANVVRGIQSMKQGGPIAGSIFAVSAQIAPHTDYAAYVEYGTGVRGGSSAGAGPGPYSPTWPGMPAQPYMRPALDYNRETAEDLIKAAVKAALS